MAPGTKFPKTLSYGYMPGDKPYFTPEVDCECDKCENTSKDPIRYEDGQIIYKKTDFPSSCRHKFFGFLLAVIFIGVIFGVGEVSFFTRVYGQLYRTSEAELLARPPPRNGLDDLMLMDSRRGDDCFYISMYMKAGYIYLFQMSIDLKNWEYGPFIHLGSNSWQEIAFPIPDAPRMFFRYKYTDDTDSDLWKGDFDFDGVSNYLEALIGSNPIVKENWSAPESAIYRDKLKTLGATTLDNDTDEEDSDNSGVVSESGVIAGDKNSLYSNNIAIRKKRDKNNNGWTQHQEFQLGYTGTATGRTPPTPRYALIDIGIVEKLSAIQFGPNPWEGIYSSAYETISGIEEKPVAISEKNGWVVSNFGRRWHLTENTVGTRLNGFKEIDTHEGVYFELGQTQQGYFGRTIYKVPIYAVPNISDINNEGAVLTRGYMYSRWGTFGEWWSRPYTEIWKPGIIPGHGLNGFYWDSNGSQVTLSAESNNKFGRLASYIWGDICQAWGIKFLNEENNNNIVTRLAQSVIMTSWFWDGDVPRWGANQAYDNLHPQLAIGTSNNGNYTIKDFKLTKPDINLAPSSGSTYTHPFFEQLSKSEWAENQIVLQTYIGSRSTFWPTTSDSLKWINRNGDMLMRIPALNKDNNEWYFVGSSSHSIVISDWNSVMPSPETFATGPIQNCEIYEDIALNCVTIDKVAVGAYWENYWYQIYGDSVIVKGEKVANLPIRPNEEPGVPLFINKQSDNIYTVAAERHLWQLKDVEIQDKFDKLNPDKPPQKILAYKQPNFEGPARFSALVNFDCGWTDGWEITGINDTGVIIGTGYKFKVENGTELYDTTEGGERIITHKYYLTTNEDNSKIEKHNFVAYPMEIRTMDYHEIDTSPNAYPYRSKKRYLIPKEDEPIFKKKTKIATEIKVSQWYNPMDYNGTDGYNFEENENYLDPDAFFVRIVAPPLLAGQNYQVKVWTDSEGEEYDDSGAILDLKLVDEEKCVYQSKPLYLVSDLHDKNAHQNASFTAFYEDGIPVKRSFLVALGGKVHFRLITPGRAMEPNPDITLPVLAKKVLKMKGFIFKKTRIWPFPDTEYGNMDVAKQQLKVARERYAQSGIKIEGNIEWKEVPDGMNFNNELNIADTAVEVNGKVYFEISDTLKTLIEKFPKSDEGIQVFFIPYNQTANTALAFARPTCGVPPIDGVSNPISALDSGNLIFFDTTPSAMQTTENSYDYALSHEFLHLLINSWHADDDTSKMDSDRYKYFKDCIRGEYIKSLWNTQPNLNIHLYQKKRLSDEMEYEILEKSPLLEKI